MLPNFDFDFYFQDDMKCKYIKYIENAIEFRTQTIYLNVKLSSFSLNRGNNLWIYGAASIVIFIVSYILRIFLWVINYVFTMISFSFKSSSWSRLVCSSPINFVFYSFISPFVLVHIRKMSCTVLTLILYIATLISILKIRWFL